jgi:hypothetical protein
MPCAVKNHSTVSAGNLQNPANLVCAHLLNFTQMKHRAMKMRQFLEAALKQNSELRIRNSSLDILRSSQPFTGPIEATFDDLVDGIVFISPTDLSPVLFRLIKENPEEPGSSARPSLEALGRFEQGKKGGLDDFFRRIVIQSQSAARTVELPAVGLHEGGHELRVAVPEALQKCGILKYRCLLQFKMSANRS